VWGTHQRFRFWPEKQFGSVANPSKQPKYIILAGLVPGANISPWFIGHVYYSAEPYFCELSPLAAIENWSCDRITIWYKFKSCGLRCSFYFHSRIWDLITIGWAVVKQRLQLLVVWSLLPNCDQISNSRMGGETVSKAELCMYRSSCDTITTQILIWSERSEFVKTWHHTKNRKFDAVWCIGWVNLVLATGPNSRVGSGSNSNLEPNRSNGFPHKTRSSKVNISCFN
jgi:hypothetical protein